MNIPRPLIELQYDNPPVEMKGKLRRGGIAISRDPVSAFLTRKPLGLGR